MRKMAEIQAFEHEMFDRVWYIRKLVMLEKIQVGEEEISDENLMDRVTQAMREVEAKYGAEIAEGVSDWDYGYWSGHLSALRWVMGDDRDFLDT